MFHGRSGRVLIGFWEGLGVVLGRFRGDVERILKVFGRFSSKNSPGAPFERDWDFERICRRIFDDFGKHLEAQTMIRATEGTSRSTNHWSGSWIVRRGPKGLGFR